MPGLGFSLGAGLVSAKAWLRGPFVCNSLSAMYAPTKPSRASTNEFHQVVDTLMYTCGAPILPEGHPVAEIFIARQDISCNDPVEKQYYSCKKFDLICCRCGSTEPDAPLNEEMKRQYKVVKGCLPYLFRKGRQACCLCTNHGDSIRRKEEDEEEALN